MSYKLFHHPTHVSELPLMDFMRPVQRVVIKGKVDGQARSLPNIKQPIMVQKKKLNKISNHGIIFPIGVPSHNSRIFTIQNQGIVLGEVEIGFPLGVVNLRYKLYDN